MANLGKTLSALAAGELYADLIMSGFEFWPAPGQEAFAREFHREIGGGAAITACGLARLGVRSGLLGVVGEDGEWLTGELSRHGVDVTDVRIDPVEPTAFTVAITSPEDRAFLTYPGANRGFPAALAQAAAAQQLSRVSHVHLAFAPELSTAADLFLAIRGNGCTLSLDVGWHEEWLGDPRALAALKWVDVFFPNETEARRITGEEDPALCLGRLGEAGVKLVALKLGSRGAALWWNGTILSGAAHPAAPVDTTGAGDCFDAGFLYAWLKRKPPEAILRTANICGALSTENYGGIAGFPKAARLKQELAGD